MSNKQAYSIAFALGSVLFTTTPNAFAISFSGSNVTVASYCCQTDTPGNLMTYPASATVDSTLEFPYGTVQTLNVNNIVPVNINITDSQIIITATTRYFPNQGFKFFFQNAPDITSVAINAQSGFLPRLVKFTENTLYFDASNVFDTNVPSRLIFDLNANPESGFFLPDAIDNGSFHFNIIGVGPNITAYIDPEITVGYNYSIGAGNPNFESVILPNIGDGIFIIDYIFNGQQTQTQITHNIKYLFPQGGVSAFRVTGIETSAGLYPEDPSAFVTGLTFVSQGNFTGTMTPITEFVPGPMIGIPEPDTLSTMFGGMLTFMALASVGRIRCARHGIKSP